MDSLNLDIDSYTPFDLQKLFSLSADYTESDVKNGFNKLVSQLEKTKSLSMNVKVKINKFIETAADYLASQAGKSDPLAGTWGMSENPMDTGSSHFVISDPNRLAGRFSAIADGRQAGTDDVPPGWLNPINVRTVMHGLNLDSRFRDNYYATSASDFTFHLPNVQRKVTNMRIATLDIPMSYHSINRGNGSSTMLIFPQPVNYNEATAITNNNTSLNQSMSISPQNVWVSAEQVMAPSNTSYPNEGPSGSLDASTAGLLFNGAIDYFFQKNSTLQGTTVLYGTWQGEGKYNVLSSLPEPTGSGAPTYRAAWLLVVPDGNYETAWSGQSEAMDIVRAMNQAISVAQPCVVDTGSGTIYYLLSQSEAIQGNPIGPVPFINAGLGGKLVYSVDRASGRSIFALPDTYQALKTQSNNDSSAFADLPGTPNVNNDGSSNGGSTSNTTAMFGPSIDGGFQLTFAVDSAGNFNPSTNIQLRLGWQLGYRIGQYDCLGYFYDSASATVAGSSGTDYYIYENATSVMSEGVCMITGPRYMYLSIDDGNNNSGSNFTAVFSESTLGEHVMTRINLSSTLDSTGVYKCASDAGLSNQLNRTREYFGPVDISRLKIKLMDEYGRIINFNNMDWSMSMVFEKLYD